MKKRRLCMICLPVILWIFVMGVGLERKSDQFPCPFPEGSMLCAEGVIDQIQQKDGRQSIYIKHISISDENNSSSAYSADKDTRIKVELQKNRIVQIGNKVKVRGKCQYFSKAENDGAFDARNYYASLHVVLLLKKAEILKKDNSIEYLKEFCRSVREICKKRLEQMLSEEEAGVMESLLLGDKSGLDTEIRDLYQKNGIIHVLAISGLHVSMIGTSLFHCLRKQKFGFTGSSLLAGIFIWFYGFFTGFSVSATRAILMFYIFLGAQMLGRTTDLITSMTVSAVLMLIKNPQLFFQSGFLMSYGAVAGVAAAGSIPEHHHVMLSALKVSIGTWLFTLPFTAYFYYQVPIYGILLNLFVVPSMSVIVTCGILGLVAGMVSVTIGSFFLAPVHYLLQITFFLCRWFSQFPGAVWITGRPSCLQMGAYYLVLILLVVFLQKMRKIDLIKTAFGIILGIGILCYRGNRNWSVTFLSVGQGDGICIQTEKGHAWVVDGGSSTQKQLARHCLEPYLKYHGISEVEGWMVSHFDQDHISGLMEILDTYHTGITGKNQNGITIKKLLLPDIDLTDELEEKILELAGKHQIPVLRCARGDTIEQDQMQIRVLQPQAGYSYESANAGSMTLSVLYHDFSLLLTGDLEGEGEKQLLENNWESVDVLKVAHHGSKNSSSEEVLQAIGGKIAVISCGKENRYGHPHQELLERLKKSGYQIMRTDQEGMIRFTVN